MKKILILFAHPTFHKSRINKKLINAVENLKGITINNLYENYPDFFIKVKNEQKLLVEHDVIIWHHPFYWYSAPAIIHEWMDLVLEHGFAYGINGKALKGKKSISVITTGGKKEIYCKEGRNHFTINQFLAPFNQSANLCGMTYLPPFVVHGSHTISYKEIDEYAQIYHDLIVMLRDDKIDLTELLSKEYSNDLFETDV
ncbi:MAG: NAD(P)H oxidoreductase [Draconibacterium sp.]|nr:NAD(P)H oxidoreductase [Draconibacterium sp.]